MKKGTKFIVTSLAGLSLLGGGLFVGASTGYIDWSGTHNFVQAQENLSELDGMLGTKQETIEELRSERDQLVKEKAEAEEELDKLEDVTNDENFQTNDNHALRIRFAREHYEAKVQELEDVEAKLADAEAELAEAEELQRRVEDALDEMEEATEGSDTNGNFVARIMGVKTRYETLEEEHKQALEEVENALDEMEEATGGPSTNGNFVARIFGVKTRYETLKEEHEQAEEDVKTLLETSEHVLEKHQAE